MMSQRAADARLSSRAGGILARGGSKAALPGFADDAYLTRDRAHIQSGSFSEHRSGCFDTDSKAVGMVSMSKILGRSLLATLLAVSWGPALGADQSWDFRVFLDDKEIGTHRFDLVERGGGQRQLTSQARMTVKILFVTAYSYDHHDVEHWDGDCLNTLSSSTDDNGKKHRIEVKRTDRDTVVKRLEGVGKGVEWLSECVLTFAYWNPAMLQQSRLLNSQNGDYVDVRITDAGLDPIVVRGVKTPARRYELRSEKLSIDLWYSEQKQWLALESTTERGQKLIYQLK